jgi:fatty-acyl-CoA synthase
MNLWDFLADAERRWPTRPALGQGAARHDYTSAAMLTRRIAAALRAHGVAPGDRVGCLMQNGIEHFAAYFGAAAAGAIFVSLNTRLHVDEHSNVLTHAGATVLMHDDAHAARAAELAARGIRRLAAAPAMAATTLALATPTPLPANEPAQLYYTSGTTGNPKGVVLTHTNVTTHALAAVAELGLGEHDTWAHIAPMFHLADAWATFAITAVGGRHVFLPVFDAERALDLLEHERVTITNLVPTMLNLMVKHASATGRRYALRTMLSGGAAIAPDVVRRILSVFGCEYVQTYGMTETSPYLTLSLLDDTLRRLPKDQQLALVCKTGRPFHGVDLRVVTDDGRPVPSDGRSVGEIRVRGKTVTPGYWRNPEATAAAFDEHGYLCTGDLATLDAHGFVDIVDRKKDVIKTGAETVYSIEVENVLYEHPAVLECAVYGSPDERWGERVTAAVVLRHGVTATAEELISFVRGRIAAYKAPKHVDFLTALPRTGSGKIQKRALRGG